MEGKDVKRIRLKLGDSQAQFARRLTDMDGEKVSVRTVQSWEQGGNDPLRRPNEKNVEKLRKLEKE